MTNRPIVDEEALRAALAERALEDAAAAPRAASGSAAGTRPPAPDPEELLDYLAGRLAAEDAQRVERRLVADPEAARALLDLAEFEAAAREAGAAGGGTGGEGGGEARPVDLAVRAGWRHLRGRLAAEAAPSRRPGSRAPWYLAAALAVVGLGLGYRAWQLQEELGRPVAVAVSLDLHAGTRAGGAGPEVELAGGWRLLVVIEPAARCDDYRAVIERTEGGDRVTVPGLVRDAQGVVMFHWTPAPGAYTLTLSGCGGGGEPEEHRFRVARPPPGRPGDGR